MIVNARPPTPLRLLASKRRDADTVGMIDAVPPDALDESHVRDVGHGLMVRVGVNLVEPNA